MIWHEKKCTVTAWSPRAPSGRGIPPYPLLGLTSHISVIFSNSKHSLLFLIFLKNNIIFLFWLLQALYFVQSLDCGRLRLPTTVALADLSSAYNLSDFCLLHCQCASCRLLMSDGWPFRLIGMMWSITGDKGCGYFNDLSTGSPQIPQVFLVFRIIFLFFSKATLWGPLRSGLSWGVFI